MKWIPTPPTDNLYKYMAITGVWLTFGLVVAFLWIGHLNYQLNIRSGNLSVYAFAQTKIFEIERRLKSLEDNDIHSNKLDWLPESISNEEEFLKQILNNHIKNKTEAEKSLDNKDIEITEILEHMKLHYIFSAYAVISLFLLIFGFWRWYKLVQIPNEKASVQQSKINELAIEKLKQEIEINSNKLMNRTENTSVQN